MKQAFYFILGIALVVLTSATTVSVMTVKPAQPKQFMVKNFINESDCEQVGIYIKQQMKKGWILKEVEGANNGEFASTWVVVMEKY
jgi:hypothetical protein